MGGASHPDELRGRLTSRQWAGWQIYCRLFPTPTQRADINTALIRQSCGQWKKAPKLKDLLNRYGKRRGKSDQEMKEIAMAWASAGKRSNGHQ